MNIGWICLLPLVAACDLGEPNDRIVVTEQNGAGVASLELERFDSDGYAVTELRGFDANEQQVALFRLRVGEIADLATYAPSVSDNMGSELIFSVQGTDTRMITRERHTYHVPAPEDPGTAELVGLQAVASALATANIYVDGPVESSGEVGLLATSCPASYMLTSPVAAQCCYGDRELYVADPYWTRFVNPNGVAVDRRRTGSGAACKASDGVSACAGASCYYGPNGFARAVMTVPPASTPYTRIEIAYFPLENKYYCKRTFLASPNPGMANVTGTYPTGQGCPGGGAGWGEWDY